MATKSAISGQEALQSETRGQRLWSALRERRDTEPVSLERAKLVTASYKETEGLPVPIRRAKAFEKIVTEIPIFIDEGQLLAGDFGSRPMAAEWAPEFTVEWVLNELKDGVLPYRLGKEEARTLREICAYWKNIAFKESFFRYLGPEEMKKVFTFNENGSWIFAASVEAQTEKGWNVPDYEKAIRLGYRDHRRDRRGTAGNPPSRQRILRQDLPAAGHGHRAQGGDRLWQEVCGPCPRPGRQGQGHAKRGAQADRPGM